MAIAVGKLKEISADEEMRALYKASNKTFGKRTEN